MHMDVEQLICGVTSQTFVFIVGGHTLLWSCCRLNGGADDVTRLQLTIIFDVDSSVKCFQFTD